MCIITETQVINTDHKECDQHHILGIFSHFQLLYATMIDRIADAITKSQGINKYALYIEIPGNGIH